MENTIIFLNKLVISCCNWEHFPFSHNIVYVILDDRLIVTKMMVNTGNFVNSNVNLGTVH